MKNHPDIIDKIERYLTNRMDDKERVELEHKRLTDTELDQLVVEHSFFLHRLGVLKEHKQFRNTLTQVHKELSKEHLIHTEHADRGAKLIYFFKRYKRVAILAACIASITAFGILFLYNYFIPNANSAKVLELVNRVNKIDSKTKQLDSKIEDENRQKFDMPVRYNGTGFMIDGKGLLVTNAHVVKNSTNIYVQNYKGEQFKAIVLKLDYNRDVAILIINDDRYTAEKFLPYRFSRRNLDLAEEVFTLGYPKSEIVFSKGYISARNGYNGDTLAYQLSIAANPGNSGGPVFNTNGDVIGILSGKKAVAESVVYAVRSKYIFQAVDELRTNELYKKVKIPQNSVIRGIPMVKQVNRVKKYVYMIKGN